MTPITTNPITKDDLRQVYNQYDLADNSGQSILESQTCYKTTIGVVQSLAVFEIVIFMKLIMLYQFVLIVQINMYYLVVSSFLIEIIKWTTLPFCQQFSHGNHQMDGRECSYMSMFNDTLFCICWYAILLDKRSFIFYCLSVMLKIIYM